MSVPAGTLSIRPAANSKAGAKICFVEISPAASTATDVAAEETVRDLRVAESGSEAPLDLLITSVRGNVRLDRADDGSCVLSGSIPGQPSFNTHGQNVTVTINGQTQVFVLNRKGIASHGTDRFTLKFRKAKQKNGTTPSTDSAASFTLKLRGPLASSALSLGSEVQPLADTAPFDVHLYMLIDGRPYSSSVTTQCSVTKQAKATFKYTRSE